MNSRQQLKLVSPGDQAAERRPNLGEAWLRVVVQWQIVGLYAAAFWLRSWIKD
jgi:hypothetical protein